jgi:hypothetical protein
MYLVIGETKLLIGQYGEGEATKLELNFEYLFDSYSSYRRFAQVIADTNAKTVKIKIKSEFTKPSDCTKLSQLLIGVQKLITQKNLRLIGKILETGDVTPQDFVQQQKELIEYFL